MKIIRLLCNEARLHCYLVRRYWQESLAAVIAMLGVFAGLLYTVTALGNVSMESGQLNGLIIGFVLWLFAGSAYASTASEAAEEIRMRSLEQLCVASVSLTTILGLRALINIGASICGLTIMLFSVDLLAGEYLALPYFTVLGILLWAAPSLVGLGYMISGITLIARKAEAMQLLVYPALIPLVAYTSHPADLRHPLALLPFNLGASAARAAASGDTLGWETVSLIGAISLLWLLSGAWVFQRCEHHARRLGIMGHV